MAPGHLGRRELTLDRTKTSRPRLVPLTDEAVELLSGLPRHLHSRCAFWHGEGERYRRVSNRFRVYADGPKDADGNFIDRIDKSARALRHKFARDFLRDGGQIHVLSRILGHSSVQTTEIYADNITRDLHAEMRQVEEAWRQPRAQNWAQPETA